MALITALVLALVMLSLALSFLYFLERDYRFAGHQEQAQEAYYLAVGGLRFQAARSDLLPPGSATLVLPIPANSQTHFARVSVSSTGQVTSTGLVRTITGVTEAERTLIVEPNSPNRLYKDQSL